MRYKRANIDSLNLASETMETIFFYNKNYIIETVKSKHIFNPKVWSRAFGKALTKNIINAKIIHTYLGLKLPLKTFSVTPKSQTLEFAGLYGYNERSKYLLLHLQELKSQLMYARVTRIDIAIDFKNRIPGNILKTLSKHRKPYKYKNSTYFKTEKEKHSNRIMDIKIYNKSLKVGLNEKIIRLEFCFKSGYLNNILLKDMKSIYIKIEKSIKRITGLNVKINHI